MIDETSYQVYNLASSFETPSSEIDGRHLRSDNSSAVNQTEETMSTQAIWIREEEQRTQEKRRRYAEAARQHADSCLMRIEVDCRGLDEQVAAQILKDAGQFHAFLLEAISLI
ncbi:MAG: hypothetical protein AAB367_03395 [Patescibacteria group bacterium]